MQALIYVFHFDATAEPVLFVNTNDLPLLENKCLEIIQRETVCEVNAWDVAMSRILVNVMKSPKKSAFPFPFSKLPG